MNVMGLIILAIVFLLLLLDLYRDHWYNRDLPQVYTAEFSGELFKVGTTYVARRSAGKNSSQTIICFPGFLEDMRYFQDLYKHQSAELLLVNNANYHNPFSGHDIQPLDWPGYPYDIGTIEHDGFYLGLVLKHLATGKNITIHSHSRGGAVVLEMGRQYPELASKIKPKIILEAPVLPQAKTPGRSSELIPHRIACYLMPIFMGRRRNITTERLLKIPMMNPTTPLKTELCRSVFCTARNYYTCVRNFQSIVSWQREINFDVYKNFDDITILLGERETSVDRPTQLESAKAGQARIKGLSIIETIGTNHFISLEQPETILGLYDGHST